MGTRDLSNLQLINLVHRSFPWIKWPQWKVDSIALYSTEVPPLLAPHFAHALYPNSHEFPSSDIYLGRPGQFNWLAEGFSRLVKLEVPLEKLELLFLAL